MAEEKAGATLRNGQSVDARIRSGTAHVQRKAIVVFVAPVVDPASGLMEVRAEFDNRDAAVRPGASGYLQVKKPKE